MAHDKRKRSHAPTIKVSCGALLRSPGMVYRCDLMPKHPGLHHVCGGTDDKQQGGWQLEWHPNGGVSASSGIAAGGYVVE